MKKNTSHYNRIIALCVLICLPVLQGCSSVGSYQSLQTYNKPLFGEIDYQSIRYEGLERNPVIVIPGILGSRLIDTRTDTTVWGTVDGQNIFMGIDDKIGRSLALPMEEGQSLNDARDTIISTDAINTFRINLLGVPFHINAYQDMLAALSFGGYYSASSENIYNKSYYTCFQFGYDWRRDIAENAVKLHDFIAEKRHYLQQEYEKKYGIKDYDVHFDIVSHSMGGLLARYYLRYGGHMLPEDGSLPTVTWEGCEYINKVIIIGTPNAGYLDALLELVHGMSLVPGVKTFKPAILGTFPSLYEMLPLPGTRSLVDRNDQQGPGLDVFDSELWKKMQWGLASPGQSETLAKILPSVASPEERYRIAVDYQKKCLQRARQFSDALNCETPVPPNDLRLNIFVGDAVETHAVAACAMDSGKIDVIKYGPGDGKVLAASALADTRMGGEWQPFLQSSIRWDSIIYLFAGHMGITRSPVFIDNMLFALLEMGIQNENKGL